MVHKKKTARCGGFGWYYSKRNKPQESKEFGFQALKINGTYVSTDIMKEERNKFFEYKRNADVLRMNDHERNDMLLDQVIERLLLEDYVKLQRFPRYIYEFPGVHKRRGDESRYQGVHIKAQSLVQKCDFDRAGTG